MGYNKANVLTLNGGFTSSNPNDATTYYFGTISNYSLVTTDTQYYFIMPYNGVIIGAILSTSSNTAAGTAEDWTWFLRKNRTTNYNINTVGVSANYRQWNSFTNTSFVPIDVLKNDEIILGTLTPTWVTNPEAVKGFVNIFLKG